MPTAVSAFIIHAWRLKRLDAQIERELALQTIAAAQSKGALA
jgi:uncharacterized membrane protein